MNSKYKVAYRGRDGSFDLAPYTSEHTVREVIDFTLSNILSLQSNNSVPVAILVGTHLDKCNEEDVSALEKSVQDSFATFIRKGVLRQVNESPAKYIHQVNNVSGVSDIVRLRELISSSVHSDRFKSKPVPTSTLLLHLILRKRFGPDPGWCSLKVCVKIAEGCGISEEDLTRENDGILQYLHDSFGTILYYRGRTRQGKELKISQRVIVDPNVITRPPVELVATAFGADGRVEHAEARRIRFTGEIRHSVMKRACEDRPSDDKKELIPTDEIVELLESRYILHDDAKSADSENGDEPVYFLPCLLSFDEKVRDQSRDHSHLNDLTYAPLLLIPNKGHIPPGLFPATIVKLSQHWKLFETEIPIQNDAEPTRFRNRIHFTFKGKLGVELRALPTHLECRIRDPSGLIDPQLLSECRSELEEYFDEVLLSFFPTRKWKWNFGFYCPNALLSDKIPPHPGPLNEEQMIKCTKSGCKEDLVGLEEKHKIWFTTSKDEVPKLGEGTVFNVTHDYVSHTCLPVLCASRILPFYSLL